MLKRMDKIIEDLTEIASRRARPAWIPHGGEMSYRCWRDYYISNRVSLPYPGSLLAQPEWFKHDTNGFNDLESWCYLKHEQVTLMKAMQMFIPEYDKIWLKPDDRISNQRSDAKRKPPTKYEYPDYFDEV